MNTPLIPVTPGHLDGRQAQLVDARLLHAFLNVGRDFSNWIKGRISEYGFAENQDYLLAKVGEQLSSGTKWRIDYFLSLDMAKELAMVGCVYQDGTASSREGTGSGGGHAQWRQTNAADEHDKRQSSHGPAAVDL